MEVQTTRFGTVEIAEDRILSFPKGLLGFNQYHKYCLLQPNDDACFFWLQCLEEPSLAFVITDPAQFFPDFSVPVRAEQMEDLKLTNLEQSQIFIIVNKIGNTLTGNLQGPLIINVNERVGEQFVVSEKKWTTRHELLTLNTTVQAASA